MQRRSILTLTSALALGFGQPLLAADVPEGAELADDQSFSYRLLDQFPTLDPQLNEETAGSHVIQQLFENLMIQDAEGNIIPGVATGYEANEDNTEFTFTLRDDARWSNGDPVTAADFVYAWRRAADPATASPYAWYVELTGMENAADIIAGDAEPDTLGVEAVDDTTLRVTLTESKPYFPAMTTYATLAPVHQATVEEYGDDWTAPQNMVSNGAYVLDGVSLNEQWSGSKNPEYWDADNVVIESITGYIINESSQALTRWEAGEFDLLEPLPAGTYPRLSEEYPEAAHSTPRLCSYYYGINQREDAPEALKDVRVRQALAYAIDRNVITDQVLQGGQSPGYTFVHEATAGFDAPDIEYANWTQEERDAAAEELWEEAGSPDLDLTLIYNTDESHRQIATIISQMWQQKLGVQTTLQNMEWSTYLDERREGNFDIARGAWCGDYNEPSTFLDILTTGQEQNDGKWSNEEFDALMQQAKTSADPQQEYTAASQILSQDMGLIPIYHYANVFLLDPSMQGFPMQNVENSWYVKDFYRVASE